MLFKKRGRSFNKKPLKQGDVIESIDSAVGILRSKQYCVRLRSFIHFTATHVYYNLLVNPNFGNLPADPRELYNRLIDDRERLRMLVGKSISSGEYEALYPQNKRTNPRDFTMNLFHEIAEIYTLSSPYKVKFLFALRELQLIRANLDKLSRDEFNNAWNSACDILKGLNYDVSKVGELKTCDLYANMTYRYSVLWSQLEVLLTESDEIINESQRVNTKTGSTKETEHCLSKAKLINADIVELFTILKYWKQKNIEGDIILIEIRLLQLQEKLKQKNYLNVITRSFSVPKPMKSVRFRPH